jgi:hypothetical protein
MERPAPMKTPGWFTGYPFAVDEGSRISLITTEL